MSYAARTCGRGRRPREDGNARACRHERCVRLAREIGPAERRAADLPDCLDPGRESGRTAAGNPDAVPDAACRAIEAKCATVTREPKQAVSGRLHVPCVTAHSGTPLSKPGHRLLPARVGSSLHSLWSGLEREGARNPAARTPRSASWATEPAGNAAAAAETPDSFAARTHQSRERTRNPILSPQS